MEYDDYPNQDANRPWKMPYEQVPNAPGPFLLPKPMRSKVSEVRSASGATSVVIDEADVRALMKFLGRNSPWLKSVPTHTRELSEQNPPTEPSEQLEEWLHLFKTNEAEVLEHATNVSNFFAWYYAVFKPPRAPKAKKAYDWMLEQMHSMITDPTAPDLYTPSHAQIMRDYDKWMDVYGVLLYDAL